MKKSELSEKLNEVYEFTSEYVNNNGFPPSVREICSKLNIKSTATAYSYIEKLRENGLIDKSPMKKRAIKLTHKAYVSQETAEKQRLQIPLVGVVRAGAPIFAVENLEGYYPLPPDFNGRESDFFALRVSGDSMINSGIYDKDVVIIKKQDCAENGEIVVALVDDSATVKRFYLRDNKVILHPENDDMQDLIFDDVKILGIVKGLYRKL